MLSTLLPRVRLSFGIFCLFEAYLFKAFIMGKYSNESKYMRQNVRHSKKKPFGGHQMQKNWNEHNKNNSMRRERYPNVPKISLREDQVGITEYTNPTAPGFNAVIKSRYSDFQVNEIDLNDEVMILNNLSIPELQDDAPFDDDEMKKVREELKNVIPEESWLAIKKLAETPKSAHKETDNIEIDINELDKDERTKVHALLKQLYGGKIVSATVSKQIDGNERKMLTITKPKGNRLEKRRKWTFPGEYVNFLVYKENLDTTEIASHLAQNLNMAASKVNYCGTKDKRAITTQKFCIKKRTPSHIVAAVRGMRNVKIGNFSFSQDVLKLGDLHGNQFRIALRHIKADKESIESALVKLRERGFINYYGLQRFGNCAEIPTYEIGVALMKADYKTACELILKPRTFDLPFLKEIREYWWEKRDSKTAVSMFRANRFIEKKLLDGLARYGENDYATALRKLPRNLLLLYPHAFQSLVFNRIASRRIKEYGLKIIPGDLVYRNEANVDVDVDEDIQIEDVANLLDDNLEANISDCEDATTKDDKTTTATTPDAISDEILEEETETDTTKSESDFKQKVRALTNDDIESGKFTIHDIVLPLPGYDIKYPENQIEEWYKEVLNEFDLTSEALNHNVKTFKMAGAYRKLVVLPKNFKWQFRRYMWNDSQLIPSDLDVLMGRENVATTDIADSTNEFANLALLLEFSLPTSCYATMLLRELLKADTSSTNQASLENESRSRQNDEGLTQKTPPPPNNEEQEGIENRKRSVEQSNNENETASKIPCNNQES